MGTNPRAWGDNPRAAGTNPRANEARAIHAELGELPAWFDNQGAVPGTAAQEPATAALAAWHGVECPACDDGWAQVPGGVARCWQCRGRRDAAASVAQLVADRTQAEHRLFVSSRTKHRRK